MEDLRGQDIIDSRDVIERMDDLLAQGADITEDEKDELDALVELCKEGSDLFSNWEHGEGLIRDSYFQEYARDLAEDHVLLQDDARWPYTCIDWEHAADVLKADYSSVEFGGITYWGRS